MVITPSGKEPGVFSQLSLADRTISPFAELSCQDIKHALFMHCLCVQPCIFILFVKSGKALAEEHVWES